MCFLHSWIEDDDENSNEFIEHCLLECVYVSFNGRTDHQSLYLHFGQII